MAYNKINIVYVQNPLDPSGPYVPSNVAANPQPGDQTIQDIFQNIFDNWNKTPGTYALAGVSTASNGTRTALSPASLNQGVLPAYELVYPTTTTGAPGDPTQQLKNPQPLYENLNYVRYKTVYVENTLDPTGPYKPSNVEDTANPFKPDAFDYVFMKVQYPSTSTGAPGVPTNVAGRVPQPYAPVRIQYVQNPLDPTGPYIPSTVTVSVRVMTGEDVLLTLDISADPDSPYLTLEDDVHSFGLSIP